MVRHLSVLEAGDEGKELPVHEYIVDNMLAPGAPVGMFSTSAGGSPVDIALAEPLKGREHPVHRGPHPDYPFRGAGDFDADASGNLKAFAGHAVNYAVTSAAAAAHRPRPASCGA